MSRLLTETKLGSKTHGPVAVAVSAAVPTRVPTPVTKLSHAQVVLGKRLALDKLLPDSTD